ncbi:unnamed protein product [Rhizophagus irregularis]|nr:unnamed protein product [Rhizophagus irregularis]
MGCLLKSFVKILQTAKLSKLSKQSKSSEPSKLSMPLLVQSFRHKNIERNFRSYTAAEFARRSGKICPSQKLEHLYPKWIFHYSSDSPNVLFKMAAGLVESIIKNHPFIDGNKRAAHLAVGVATGNFGFQRM